MSKTSKIVYLVLVILVVILGGVYINGSSSDKGIIKIGVIIPLSGPISSYGEAAMGGFKLAQKEINESGGILNRQVELLFEDDQCDSNKGISAYNKLKSIDRVSFLFVFSCNDVSGPIIPLIQKDKIPSLVFVAPKTEKPQDNYVFRNYPADFLQGQFIANFAWQELKKKKAAVVFIKNNYGEEVSRSFVEEFKKLGGEIVLDDGISENETDLKTEWLKVKEQKADFIYFPAYSSNYVTGLKQMKEIGLSIPVVVGETIATEEVKKLNQAQGVLFVASKSTNPEGFQTKVKTVHNGVINFLTPYAYDAFFILKDAIAKTGSLDNKGVRNNLAKTSYRGIASPLVEFKDDGNLKEAKFEVMMIKNSHAVPYK